MRSQQCSLLVVASVLAVVSSVTTKCGRPRIRASWRSPSRRSSLYHFDLKKWFYADDAARKQDIADAEKLIVILQGLKPKAGHRSARPSGGDRAERKALDVIRSRCGRTAGRSLGDRHDRYDVRDGNEEANELEDRAADETTFIVSMITDLAQSTPDEFVAKEPGLKTYEYFLAKSRKSAAHSAGNDA